MYKNLLPGSKRSILSLLAIWLTISVALMIVTSHQETYSGQYVTSKDHPSPNTIGPPLIKEKVVDSSYPDEMCAMMGVSAGEVSYSGIPLTYKTTTTSGTCVTNTEYEIYPFSFFTNSLVIAGITSIPHSYHRSTPL